MAKKSFDGFSLANHMDDCQTFTLLNISAND